MANLYASHHLSEFIYDRCLWVKSVDRFQLSFRSPQTTRAGAAGCAPGMAGIYSLYGRNWIGDVPAPVSAFRIQRLEGREETTRDLIRATQDEEEYPEPPWPDG